MFAASEAYPIFQHIFAYNERMGPQANTGKCRCALQRRDPGRSSAVLFYNML
jgi:hypothetical protein